MRSLLVQASSVERAVEKAWATAGMPTEFTIKVHDFGQKGFLGMTKKPAIISIVYEPKKQTAISRAPQAKPQPRPRPKPQRQPRPTKPQPKPKQPKPQPKPRQEKPKTQPARPQPEKPKTFWTDTLIYDVNSWLTEMAKSMGLPTSFKVKSDKKLLTITFDQDVLESPDEERMLFSGFSYLLIQFLKKKHKKKFQGYKLILTSRKLSNKS